MTFTFLFLAGAWYFTLRNRPAAAAAPSVAGTSEGAGGGVSGDACCAQEACCAPSATRRRNILLLSAVTVFALAMLAFPQISTVLAGSRRPTPTVVQSAGPVGAATLAVKGMTCEECAVHIREALLQVPGVVAAKVEYRKSAARVTFQKGKVSPEQLKQAVAKAGYKATSVMPAAPAAS
jgi:copper chaperone CopZ